MAKKSLPNTTFAKVAFVFMVVFAAVSIYSLQGKGVLGIMTSPTPTPTGTANQTPGTSCKPPRVTVLKLSTACDSTTRDGFRTAIYQCSDGKSGDASRGCMNVSEALTYAKYACAKNYKCPITPTPTFKPESPTPSQRPPTPTRSEPTPTPTISVPTPTPHN